jgi:hypothetical protein
MGKGAKKPDLLPVTGTASDVPHTGRAVKGCACLCCTMHRELDRQGQRQHEQQAEGTPTMGSVTFGQNATDELKTALGRTES